MFKQILSRLPRKSLKSESGGRTESPRSSSPRSTFRTGPSNSGQGASKSNGLSSASARPNVARHPSSTVFPASLGSGIEPLVPFKDVPNTEKMNLFLSKVSLCCVTFDFTDPSKNCVDKDIKRQILLELVEFLASGSLKFSEPAILAICRMCSVNLFRVFPPNYRSIRNGGGGENDDDEPMFDPAWPHLQLVYELLLKFVSCSCLSAKIAKKYIDHSFILRLLGLFQSEDPRERDCVKTVLHKIYGKFMVHRPFIRKSINNVFYRFVFETERYNGVAELLEIYGSVISGFALPLKEEHKIFLWRVLIPLHKPKSLGFYFQQLSYCIMQFIEKDQKLASVVINGLLKYWPITNSQKEVMLLSELEEILELVSMMEFQKFMVPLFRRIRCCINSSHFQVAERTLLFWNNDHIVNLIAKNRQVIFPIILPVLETNSQNHWNQAVLNLTLNVRKMFLEIDDELFLSCLYQHKEEEASLSLAAEKQKEAWQRLEHAASLQLTAEKTAEIVTQKLQPPAISNN